MRRTPGSKSTAEPRKFKSSWWCDTCKTEEMDGPALKAHLLEKHGLTGAIKGTKMGLQFLDGADFYSNTYDVTIEGPVETVKLTNNVSGPRDNPQP